MQEGEDMVVRMEGEESREQIREDLKAIWK